VLRNPQSEVDNKLGALR